VREDGTAADPAARGSDLRARAGVIRRGKAISFLAVDFTDGDGSPAAKGLVTYRVFSSG
jgi:acyl-coenzyme A thioesterase PaaI-like protein